MYVYKQKNINYFIVKVGRLGERLSGRSFYNSSFPSFLSITALKTLL
uniref:Uncharacterized protein n=1 Tax=Siphoviridae sp. ctZ0X1 TaxID=2825554 RepID=A0A8S5QDR4_9CAUD|nr:MAG TPA: hypothetical protein [Siphoviridae sp. ctZ0X1]